MSLLAISISTLVLLYGILFAVAAYFVITGGGSMLAALGIAAAVLIVQFIISPWMTDLRMRLFYKMKFQESVIPPYLESFIQSMCVEQNMKYPKVGVINDGSPNAFTYGHTKNDARIVVTRGLLEMLDEDEAKAVVAHEIGHAVHYDMLIMTAVQIVPMFLYSIFRALMDSSKSSKSKSKDDKGGSAVLVAVVIYLLYIITQYIILWFSRTREYFADDFSARATRKPNALASALVQVGFGLSTVSTKREAKQSAASTSALGIADGRASKGMALCCMDGDNPDKSRVKTAMRWDMWNVWAKLYELKSTHPLISKRILRLSAVAEEFGQAPYITFDEKRDESYVDDFFRELFIALMPWLALIAGIICQALTPNPCVLFFGLALFFALSLLKLRYTHPIHKEWKDCKVEDLLSLVKVSGVTPVPCRLKGRVIGRGDPGCIFSEDFVLQDETGIIFLNYNRPLTIQNKLFALFRSGEYLYNDVEITGWYRRAPSPCVDMRFMSRGETVRRCDSTRLGKILRWAGLIICAVIAVSMLLTVHI